MTDIVERLRWWAYKFCGKGVQEDDASDVMTNAIHEIEKLRAALKQAARYVDNLASERYALQAENERLRAALGEKE